MDYLSRSMNASICPAGGNNPVLNTRLKLSQFIL
jgi:hypothetical protein